MKGIFSKDYFEVYDKAAERWGHGNFDVLPLPDGHGAYERKNYEIHMGIEAPAEYWEDLAICYFSVFVVKYRTVYQVRYSANCGGCVLDRVYYKQPCNGHPILKRGYWDVFTGQRLNELLGIELFGNTEVYKK